VSAGFRSRSTDITLSGQLCGSLVGFCHLESAHARGFLKTIKPVLESRRLLVALKCDGELPVRRVVPIGLKHFDSLLYRQAGLWSVNLHISFQIKIVQIAAGQIS